MFKSKWFYLVLIVLVAIVSAVYQKYQRSKFKDEAAYFMHTTKSAQPQLSGVLLITTGLPSSQSMSNGVACVENASAVEKVDLFMPDMGHGSEPPKVTSTQPLKELAKYRQSISNFGCYSIENMQLFMPGVWQVRVFYKDKNIGIFTLSLAK